MTRGWSLAVEWLFVAAIAAGFAYTAWFFFTYLYLPQPFFYEPSGVFMDWYSLSYWAHNRGAYDIEGSIYPPLSFVVMKLFSLPHCYLNARGEPSRDCDWLGIVVLTAMVPINFILIYLSYRKIDRRTALPRAMALGLGLPMIYAYERGNLLLFCFTCLLLAFGPLLASARARWFWAGAALNFKVYIIAAVAAPLLRRRWIATEGMLIWAAVIYVATWLILGEGSPDQIIGNIVYYGQTFGATDVLNLWYASTYIPLLTLFESNFPVYSVFGTRDMELLTIALTTLVRGTQLMIVLAAVAIWLRPEAVPAFRAPYLALALALSAAEAGGYTQILLLMFLFMERWQGIARPVVIVIAYFLCIPFEIVVGLVPPLVRWSWLADASVIAQYGVGGVALIKPALTLIVAALVAGVTIRTVWRDIRMQGWRRRYRLRRDAPVLPGVAAPDVPVPARA